MKRGWKTHRVPEQRCPRCHIDLSQASSPPERTEARPTEGSFNVCIGCGQILVFGEGLILRTATDKEVNSLSSEDSILIWKVRAAIGILRRRN